MAVYGLGKQDDYPPMTLFDKPPWEIDPCEKDEELPCAEMAELRRMLTDMGVEWEDGSDRGKNPMVYRTNYETDKGRVSVIWGFFSYGNEKGLLEAWDFDGEPYGYLTAERVLEKYPPKGAK